MPSKGLRASVATASAGVVIILANISTSDLLGALVRGRDSDAAAGGGAVLAAVRGCPDEGRTGRLTALKRETGISIRRACTASTAPASSSGTDGKLVSVRTGNGSGFGRGVSISEG